MRVRHNLPFTYRSLRIKEGFPVSAERAEGVVIDISETGMKATLSLSPDMTSDLLVSGKIQLFIHIEFRLSKQPIDILARPMWIRDNPDKPGTSLAGFKFNHIDTASREQLINLIETLAVCGQMGHLRL